MAKFSYLVGVDGCSEGWVAVSGKADDHKIDNVHFSNTLRTLLSHFNNAIIVIDMPVKLSKGKYSRQCDLSAKKFLGAKKQASIFMTPTQQVLKCDTYLSANALSKKMFQKGLTKQAWNLRNKIFEVQDLQNSSSQIVEGHPECSFTMLKNSPLDTSKKTVFGLFERIRLLEKMGLKPLDVGLKLDKKLKVKPDDLIDAIALFWTARRISTGNAKCLPSVRHKNTDDMGQIFI
jgi:predicted RNase H-like nuclease